MQTGLCKQEEDCMNFGNYKPCKLTFEISWHSDIDFQASCTEEVFIVFNQL